MQQVKPLSLRRNFSWTFIGNAVYAACQWGMLVVLAKLGSPEMVGQFTLGLAVTAPAIMLTNLNLRAIQATDAKHQYAFGDYLALRLLSTAIAFGAIVIVVIFAKYRVEVSAIVLSIGVAKAFEAISDMFYGLFQQCERMDRIAVSMVIKGPVSLLLMGLGVYLTGSVVWGVVGLAIAQIVVLLGYDWRNASSIVKTQTGITKELKKTANIAPNWSKSTLSQLLKLSFPLGCVMMLISLNNNIPRYFIERYLGERELGIFAAIAYLIVAGRLIVEALGQSSVARLAKYYLDRDSRAFGNLLCKLIAIAFSIGAVAILVAALGGKPILTLLYNSEYAKYSDLFVWLMVAATVDYMASFLGHGMTAAQFYRIQTPLFASVTAVSAFSCFWLLPGLGLKGVVLSLILASSLQLLFSLGVIYYALRKLG
jgi:O-antigen/teichoic acid export membrane protein